MATNISISRYLYPKLNESQIYQWRFITYNNLNLNHIFTKKELLNFLNIKIPSISELFNELKQEINEKIILGELQYNKNCFILIDSSTICNLNIENIIENLLNEYLFLKDCNIILIYSNINKAENLYKKTNNYTGVNYPILNHNLDILNRINNLHFQNLIILNTNLFLDNKILMQEELKHLQNYGYWLKGSKNEINDDSQITMINLFLDYFHNSKGILVSHDKKLCNKILKNNFSNSHLYCKMY